MGGAGYAGERVAGREQPNPESRKSKGESRVLQRTALGGVSASAPENAIVDRGGAISGDLHGKRRRPLARATRDRGAARGVAGLDEKRGDRSAERGGVADRGEEA